MTKKKSFFIQIFTFVTLGFIFLILFLGSAFFLAAKHIMFTKVNMSIESTLNQTNNIINNRLFLMDELSTYYSRNRVINTLIKKEPSYFNTIKMNEIIENMNNLSIGLEEYVVIVGQGDQLFINWESDGNINTHPSINRLRDILKQDSSLFSDSPTLWLSDFAHFDPYNSDKELIVLLRLIKDYDLKQNETGLVAVGISKESLSSTLDANKVIPDSTIYLVDETGKIVLHEQAEKVGTTLEFPKHLKEISSFSTPQNFLYKYEGKKEIIFFSKLLNGYMTILSIPYSSYMQEINSIILIMFFSLIIALLFSVSIAMIISINLSKPVKTLINSMDSLKNGNFNVQVQIPQSNELSILGYHFNSMSKQLDALMQERIKSEKLQAELTIASKNAELQMLRAQINPHFLFNTLNSIKCLALIHKIDSIAHMIGALGTLLENSMGKGRDFLSIKEELFILESYIEIQTLRYGNKLRMHYEIDKALYLFEIPKFILQPVVENAILHGISKKQNGGDIYLIGKKNAASITLEIRDNGPGISDEIILSFHEGKNTQSSQGLNGIGIRNIHDRIHMIYGDPYGLTIQSNTPGASVLITLPIKLFKEENYAQSSHCR